MKNDVKQHALDLAKEHGTNNPFKIAKERNIELVFEDLQHIYGYYHYCRRVQLIHINCNLEKIIQLYVCAHELGHAVRHTNEDTAFLSRNTLFSTDKLEIEANTFAVELLLPDNEVYDYLYSGYTIEQIASVYGIPKQFMKYKTFNF
ncbi:ImmA/IrrE family metallo-endopeptidase [Bacillus sp. FSL R12-0069]|uniref:ImmA/IrrE family metallo-endopeptidase n=1 Tax=Bacillus sp. FSL R12-0069 TaxID=2975342 RepID=UPI0030FA5FFA